MTGFGITCLFIVGKADQVWPICATAAALSSAPPQRCNLEAAG